MVTESKIPTISGPGTGNLTPVNNRVYKLIHIVQILLPIGNRHNLNPFVPSYLRPIAPSHLRPIAPSYLRPIAPSHLRPIAPSHLRPFILFLSWSPEISLKVFKIFQRLIVANLDKTCYF
jgi:hypothetical protein